MDERKGVERMKKTLFYYKDKEKGYITDEGEVHFVDKIMEDAKEELFMTFEQKEGEDGGFVIIQGELSPELKISTLKILGYSFNNI
jgi:hypothetical protein